MRNPPLRTAAEIWQPILCAVTCAFERFKKQISPPICWLWTGSTRLERLHSTPLHDGRETGDRGIVNVALQHRAAALSQQDPRRAARLLGYVRRALKESGLEPEYTERFTRDLLLSRLRETLSEDEIAALADTGAAMSEDQAVRLAERKHNRGVLVHVTSAKPDDGRATALSE
jgi:hypothetical protein